MSENQKKLIIEIEENMPYHELAKKVAHIIKTEYGTHNIKPFMKELFKEFETKEN